jgi:Asp-tRNA(Asn)/Glu-tRNA(Gln) amidotransferase C subunit
MLLTSTRTTRKLDELSFHATGWFNKVEEADTPAIKNHASAITVSEGARPQFNNLREDSLTKSHHSHLHLDGHHSASDVTITRHTAYAGAYSLHC